MQITDIKREEGFDGSLRHLLFNITINKNIDKKFIDTVLPTIQIVNSFPIEDIVNQKVFDTDYIPYKILCDPNELIGKQKIPAKIDFTHISTIPTYDGYIGARQNTEIRLNIVEKEKKEVVEYETKSFKDTINLETNIENLKTIVVDLYDQLENIKSYLDNLNVPKKDTIIKRLDELRANYERRIENS